MDLGLLIRLLPDCCTLAFPLGNCHWPSCWRKDWMYAPSKHANTKSSLSWPFMILSRRLRRSLRIQWLLLLARPSFYTVGTNVLQSCPASTSHP